MVRRVHRALLVLKLLMNGKSKIFFSCWIGWLRCGNHRPWVSIGHEPVVEWCLFYYHFSICLHPRTTTNDCVKILFQEIQGQLSWFIYQWNDIDIFNEAKTNCSTSRLRCDFVHKLGMDEYSTPRIAGVLFTPESSDFVHRSIQPTQRREDEQLDNSWKK